MTTRHLYNNTDEILAGHLPGRIPADLPGVFRQPDGDWAGTLAANSSCALEFDQNSGALYLTSSKGTNWDYGFSTNDLDADPSWDHHGDTPGARLNDPANGDFQIDQDLPTGGEAAAAGLTTEPPEIAS